jgi:hypothetical protein
LLKDGTVLIAGGMDIAGVVTSSAELYHPGTRTFSSSGPMTQGRARHTATLLADGRVLIAGGHDDDSAEVYDPHTRQFSAIAMVAARDFQTATLLASGRVLIAGGATCGILASCPLPPSSPGAELFDPTGAGTFAATSGQLLQPRIRHTATLLRDGTVLLAGGLTSSSQVLSSTELYNPTGGTFSSAGNLVQARSFHTATVMPNGRILFAGGFGDTSMTAINSAEVFDPASGAGGTSMVTGSMAIARDSATATLLSDGRVLIAGGEDSFNGNHLASAEVYDAETGSFARTRSDMTMPRSDHTATLLSSGMVLITGGVASISTVPFPHPVDTQSAELFDPTTGTFSAIAPMTEPRHFHRAVLLADNRVLIAGGAGDLSAEIYDPVAQAFACVGGLDTSMTAPVCNASMMEIRFEHTATLLNDGAVLIAGGDTANAFGQLVEYANAEVFDPKANSGAGAFAAISNMTTERSEHTATLLNDGSGRVLITGGTHSHSALPSAELFTPR